MILNNVFTNTNPAENRIVERLEMKKLSIDKLVETIHALRKKKGLTQAQLADATGINRAMIGRIENKDYVPTVD